MKLKIILFVTIIVVLSSSLIFIQKNNVNNLNSNLLQKFEQYQYQRIEMELSFMKKGLLVGQEFRKITDESLDQLYEERLKSFAYFYKVGPRGFALLVDENFKIISSPSPELSDLEGSSFKDVAENSTVYGFPKSNSLIICYNQMTWGNSSGDCLHDWENKRYEHIHWRKVINISLTKNYYVISSFDEADIIKDIEQIDTFNLQVTLMELFLILIGSVLLFLDLLKPTIKIGINHDNKI